jgi:L-lysine 2,3-aminomutase
MIICIDYMRRQEERIMQNLLIVNRSKLTAYDGYLLTKHFPAQEKRFLAEQKSAGAKRKGARRAAIIRAGLVDEVEDVNKDSDANDGNDSVKVFQRKAPSKVLLKTKDLCNGYF